MKKQHEFGRGGHSVGRRGPSKLCHYLELLSIFGGFFEVGSTGRSPDDEKAIIRARTYGRGARVFQSFENFPKFCRFLGFLEMDRY